MSKKLQKKTIYEVGNLLLDRYGSFSLITEIDGEKIRYHGMDNDYESYTTNTSGDDIYIVVPEGVTPEEHIATLKKEALIKIADDDFVSRSVSGKSTSTSLVSSSAPSIPDTGIYTIETHEECTTGVEKIKMPVRGRFSEETYTETREWVELEFKYLPDDLVYSDWYYDSHKRKNRVTFQVNSDDTFIFNYDLLSLDDIEFYINCRTERRHYLDILPVLYSLRTMRLAEIEWEKGFVELLKRKYPEDKIWEAIDWWKNKVIWKRPLTKDDAKALRMIEGRLKRGVK